MDAPCQKPQTIAICTAGRSPSGTLCFLYSGRNCVKLTQFLLVRTFLPQITAEERAKRIKGWNKAVR